MKKQYIIAICIIAFFTSLIITMNIVKENKLQNTKKEAKISEKVEDECTEECTKETKIEEVVATKEKVSANSQLIIKKYFKQCDHTINEYVEMPHVRSCRSRIRSPGRGDRTVTADMADASCI